MKGYLAKKYPSRNRMHAVFLCILVASGCSYEGDYYSDPINPRAIRYTTDGNDAAGAIIDGEKWKSVVHISGFRGCEDCPWIIYFESADSLVIQFSGSMVGSGEYAEISYSFKGLDFKNRKYQRLLGKKIALDGVTAKATLSIWGSCPSEYISTTGQFYLRQEDPLSGTFWCSVNNDCGSREITYGRFDYENLEYQTIP